MKYERFVIKKFKGIQELELDLKGLNSSKVFPLVGLNESGKTTILEAINFFQEDLKDDKKHTIMHKRDSGYFTGSVEIQATLSLDPSDVDHLNSFLKKKGLISEGSAKSIVVIKEQKYENASFKNDPKTTMRFEPELNLKSKKSPEKEHKSTTVQNVLLRQLKKRISKILYFPDFLFDFPDKIYLDKEPIEKLNSEKEKEIQKEYVQVIDDILHTINEKYSLKDFLEKIKSNEPDKKSAANQIKNQISSTLSHEITKPWQEIFGEQKKPEKNIILEKDSDDLGIFLKMSVDEGGNIFSINERSLGFRWFFAFILFTRFRKARAGESGEPLFLFDEPASNLHESSQKKLLDLFEKLSEKSKVIYSTHSPYLINPRFILNTFIVRDTGRNGNNIYEFRQNIKATPYRQFVAEHPDQETHFKPLLNALDFKATDFDLTDKILFFEGVSDYYSFKWIKETILQDEKFDFNLYPGAGVDKYARIFREYLAHNRKFIAVFDADPKEGRSVKGGKYAKNKYIEKVSEELKKNIFTLKDVDEKLDGFKTEDLFTEQERINIQKKSHPESTEYSKKQFNSAIKELFISKEKVKLSEETKENFKKTFQFVKDKFNQL